jgi:hypothetical protein
LIRLISSHIIQTGDLCRSPVLFNRLLISVFL